MLVFRKRRTFLTQDSIKLFRIVWPTKRMYIRQYSQCCIPASRTAAYGSVWCRLQTRCRLTTLGRWLHVVRFCCYDWLKIDRKSMLQFAWRCSRDVRFGPTYDTRPVTSFRRTADRCMNSNLCWHVCSLTQRHMQFNGKWRRWLNKRHFCNCLQSIPLFSEKKRSTHERVDMSSQNCLRDVVHGCQCHLVSLHIPTLMLVKYIPILFVGKHCTWISRNHEQRVTVE